MTITIDESGMQFGPFECKNLLPIETCASYKKIQNGIPIAEFMLSRPTDRNPNAIWVVEAKKSVSHPTNKEDFRANIQDICKKFTNSVHLFLSGLLARNLSLRSEIPAGMNHISAANVDFKLVLVVKKSEKEWLPSVHAALNREMRPLIKTLSLGPACVYVFNEDIARQKHLIS